MEKTHTHIGFMLTQVEVSLQPWRAFKPDGVILFSDILTPLTGMGIPFDIEAGRGPVIHTPIRTMQVAIFALQQPQQPYRNHAGSHFCPATTTTAQSEPCRKPILPCDNP